MRKILKAESWDASTSFTSANVLDESHWFVKLLKRGLTLLDIGNFSITYKSAQAVTLQTALYGTFDINRPTRTSSSPYILYINSVDKELWGGSSMDAVADTSTRNMSNNNGNHIRGPIRYSASGSSTGYIQIAGGILQLKFEDGTIKGCSCPSGLAGLMSLYYAPSHYGIVLPQNYEALSTPLTSVSINYTKMSIVNGYYTDPHFEGEYFRSIYLCDKYYLGALKSSDNTKFIFDGYLFLVDDARDIEIV